ncbi:MAG: transglutaminase domain-containing protein, partial [Phaeodactylibacter sp.]|nr:transglutaminase domain-containing protein [Phaeodactylibacter sp.]
PMLLNSPLQMNIEGYEGSMQDWAAFGQFMNQLYEGRDVLPENVRTEVQEIVKGAATDREKIERLYDYLKGSMRYVSIQLGIGGWQPFEATYGAETKYGDCKALSNYMMALLKEAGIESHPVITYRGNLEYLEIDEAFATSAFNHVLLHVPKEDLFLECTSNNYPAGFIGLDNENRKALLVGPAGGKVLQMPASPPEANLQVNTAVIHLNAEGGARLNAEKLYTGLQHQFLRSADFYWTPEEKEEYLRKEMPLNDYSLNDWSFEVADEVPEAKIAFDLEVNKFASTAGKRLFVTLNCLNPYDEVPEELEARTHPIYRKNSFVDLDTIRYILPDDYKVENVFSEPIELEASFGHYRAQVEQVKPNEWLYIRELRIEAHRLPATEYEAYRDFYKDVRKADRKKMVLIEKKT